MAVNSILKRFIPVPLWKLLRERKIVLQHAKVAKLCKSLITDYYAVNGDELLPKVQPVRDLKTRRIIWQFWSQGYDSIPPKLKECLNSIEEYKGDYLLIRLDDSNVGDYIHIPEIVSQRAKAQGLAQYSDILRVALLSAYGGVWLDATVKLTGPLPEAYICGDFFMYQRDASELRKDYWSNTYAYYFGWVKGFRVNVLNSIIFASPKSKVISTMYGLLSFYWENNTILPDYFFFQILFDVLIKDRLKEYNCTLVSDCIPHLLQQYQNDIEFNLCSEDEIYQKTAIHKLTSLVSTKNS